MIFGPCPVDQAEGAILAHSVPLAKGRLRKGRVLDAEDIARLIEAGHGTVTVARLSDDDLHEDIAAEHLARALVPDPGAAGLRIGPASTGRVNIHATGPGVIGIDPARIEATNLINPMITVATLPNWQRVAADMMVATVKIISYGVPAHDVAEATAKAADALRLHPPQRRRVVLIETTVGGPVGDKGARVTAGRLARLNADLIRHEVVPHKTEALATEIARAAEQSDLVLILTASATSDPNDTAPAALRASGGEVTHFGMPVDPGNLLFFGALGDTPVIGLPGCARSPALNGADWVLERLICGVPVTSRDVKLMGVGGLLKEIPTRPQPRDP